MAGNPKSNSQEIFPSVYESELSERNKNLSEGEFETTTETTNESETTTHLIPVTLQFAYMLELVNYNAITFLDNNLTWLTCPGFDVVTKKLHVSR